jgi:5'-deoxynucleotidase YfbR-like HD superfamily hydrolase
MGCMDFKKDKKGWLVSFINEALHYNYFLVNDTAFFKFIYIFRYLFSKLNSEKKLATFENILIYLRNRIGDPNHTAYRQAYNEFYFMPRYLYNKQIYYGLDYEEILKACRTTLIILVHDLPEESIEKIYNDIEKEINVLLNNKNKPYVYDVIQKDTKLCPENLAKYINSSQKKLVENSLSLIKNGANTANLRFIFNQIGISSSLTTHIIEKLELIIHIPDQSTYNFEDDFIPNLNKKNQKILIDTFNQFAQDLSKRERIDFYAQIGWSKKFIYKTLGEI